MGKMRLRQAAPKHEVHRGLNVGWGSWFQDVPICCCSVPKLCSTLCYPMDCSTPGSSVLHYLPEFAQTHVNWVDDAIYLILCCIPSPFAFNPSQHQGLFQWVGSSYQMVKVLELQLQHQFFQWILRDDFFRIDWFDLLAVQGTLKSLLQHHSSKVSILQCSAFFMVQLSHLYMLTRKTIALIIQTFVSKVMSLFFLIIPCHPSDLSPRVSQSKSRFLRNCYNFAIVYLTVSLPWQNYKSLSARAGNTFSLHLAFNSVWDVIDI